MMDNDKLIVYLDGVVNSVFKILPLYEEDNVGLDIYIESLLFELKGMYETVEMNYIKEYFSLVFTLGRLKRVISKGNAKKPTVKREVFKCINIIKNMALKLKEGE